MYQYLHKPRHLAVIIKSAIVAVLVLMLGLGFWLNWWYRQNISALDLGSDRRLQVTVEAGMSVSEIADYLEEQGVIRSSRAFVWYVRSNDSGLQLQAGSYSLGPSQSVAQITDILAKGLVDTELFTFLPGRRLSESRQELIDFGFLASEVDQALAGTYTSPVLTDKPTASTLEGYLFPDSYETTATTEPQQIIERALENFWRKIEVEHILAGLEEQGLDLHAGITLASIVEMESGSEADKAQIAQVFLSRLEQGMMLGADVTFRYAAEEMAVEPRIDLDSPYNTRLYAGLPPGPIANFTISSLRAVAYQADGDYLYFVAGDDGVVRFSRTFAEHNRLVEETCQVNCQLP